MRQEAARWEKALALYRKQRWDEAEAMLRGLAQAAPEAKLYKLYLKRIKDLKAHLKTQADDLQETSEVLLRTLGLEATGAAVWAPVDRGDDPAVDRSQTNDNKRRGRRGRDLPRAWNECRTPGAVAHLHRRDRSRCQPRRARFGWLSALRAIACRWC